jgi:hypothetical protein
MNTLRLFLCSLAVVLLTACGATTELVKPGVATLGDRLSFKVSSAWNHVKTPGTPAMQHVWTRDGLAIDQLRVWSPVRSGELIREKSGDERPLEFNASMSSEQIVALFEGYYARGGNRFTLTKATAQPFLGGAGTRIEFEWTMQSDNVRRSGLGYFVVRGGELHALMYTAPRLVFFAKHQQEVANLAESAALK